jgi:hypothetical protein
LTLAFYSDWPVSFCIAMRSAAGYFAALAVPLRGARPAGAGVIEGAA